MTINGHAHNAIAQRLAEHDDCDPGHYATLALVALADAGYHILTAPKVTVDPPEDSPEYEAILGDVSSRYALDERSIKRTLSATLDNEVIGAAIIFSPYEAAHYRKDKGLREYVARKMGLDFMAALWKHLAPDTAVEP